jgi:hypothetical protein
MIDCIMISIGRKLFEEIDTPTGSKVVDEGKINRIIKRESSWVGISKVLIPFLVERCQVQVHLSYTKMV